MLYVKTVLGLSDMLVMPSMVLMLPSSIYFDVLVIVVYCNLALPAPEVEKAVNNFSYSSSRLYALVAGVDALLRAQRTDFRLC